MKAKLKKGAIAFLLAAFILPVLFSGCYTDTIDAFSEYSIQLPLHFTPKWRNKQAPDTSVDYTNLNDYKEYRENKDKITTAKFYQFAYWIDSIRVGPGDPPKDSITFDYVRYYLYYSDNGQLNKYLLGYFPNVKVKDFYKNPHVIVVPEETAELLQRVAKKNPPDFYTIAEYGKITSGGSGYFPYIDSRFDVVVQFKIKL